jgi:hypothetical protein
LEFFSDARREVGFSGPSVMRERARGGAAAGFKTIRARERGGDT